ncbi:hypothetical protein NDI76_01360 [Halogeometricum sp. S1BR25-6]|uniref:RING-type E3 ubiquitin transferase n=1 Tax=Halogeometricum salsisoli TaxID=2950536 RepID=A0ABU2G995_9EURY|nr:hypothetical protein [Halogeometricum sp. S1BR25-6]MDS0297387.1 hypothetical protein [Halogeometricum sp. S1BR25-6]
MGDARHGRLRDPLRTRRRNRARPRGRRRPRERRVVRHRDSRYPGGGGRRRPTPLDGGDRRQRPRTARGFSVETSVPPERIAEFVRGEAGLSTQTDSITNVLDVGNEHGERRYYEGTLGPGDEIYLLGRSRAVENATRPLKPDDVVVAPPDDGQFIISGRSEAELADSFGQYRYAYLGAAVAAVVGVAALAVGAGLV